MTRSGGAVNYVRATALESPSGAMITKVSEASRTMLEGSTPKVALELVAGPIRLISRSESSAV
jgi:hypothetical protein